jgi:AAA domain
MSRPASIHQLGTQADRMRHINMLVFGHPGTGKTPFWGTAPNGLLIDSDHGYESAEAAGSTIDRVSVTDYTELQEIYDYLKEEKHSYEWAIWDSVTLFQERALMDDIMVDAHITNPNQEEFVPSRREYLLNMNRIGRFIRLFVELPINFGCTCHVLMDIDPSDNTSLYVPYVQGKGMPTKISGYMNVVGYMGYAKVKKGSESVTVQRLLTQRVGKFFARDRFNALGHHTDNPTVPIIQEKIEKKRAELASTPPPLARRGRLRAVPK